MEVAQATSAQGFYANLGLPWGTGPGEAGCCPLQKLRWPKRRSFWHTLAAPCRGRRIALEEAAACC
eukprot:923414-Alexandrium_andersonii.AAC.1